MQLSNRGFSVPSGTAASGKAGCIAFAPAVCSFRKLNSGLTFPSWFTGQNLSLLRSSGARKSTPQVLPEAPLGTVMPAHPSLGHPLARTHSTATPCATHPGTVGEIQIVFIGLWCSGEGKHVIFSSEQRTPVTLHWDFGGARQSWPRVSTVFKYTSTQIQSRRCHRSFGAGRAEYCRRRRTR